MVWAKAFSRLEIILPPSYARSYAFGCRADLELTYFDECLIGAWPKSQTWKQLFDRTSTCVRIRELEMSEAPSMPQSFFRADVRDLELL